MAPSTPQLAWQETAKDASQKPTLPRSGHVAAALPGWHGHDVIMFGGYVEDADMKREAANDAWIYSLSKGAWSSVTYAPGDVPRVRLAAQAVVVDRHLWLIAGWDPGHKRDGGEILSDLWRLNLSTYQWTQIKPQGEELPAISRFQAVALGSKIYIHTHRSLQDILVLDVANPDEPVLSLLPVTSEDDPPMSRGLHSLTAAADGRMFLFGGAPKEGPMLGDLWSLTVSESGGGGAWAELDPDGKAPHVRCSQAVAPVDNDIFFLGGSYYKVEGGLQPLNDFFVLDTKQLQWQYPTLDQGAGPSPRNAATLTAVGSKLVLYGGWNPFVKTYNDTFVMDVSGYAALKDSVPLEPEEDD
ncbi:g4175 [Coccomyxa elongata]